MENIFFLRPNNIEQLVDTAKQIDRSILYDVIETVICFYPSNSKLICEFILKIIEEIVELKEIIIAILLSAEGDPLMIVSKLIYGKYLGAELEYDFVEPISDIFKNIKLNHKIDEKFLQILSDDFIDTFYAYSIIQKFDFLRLECKFRLKQFTNATIIKSMLIDQSLSDIAMIIELCKNDGWIVELSKHINKFERKSQIIALILLTFIKGKYVNNKSDLEILKNMFENDEKNEKYALNIISVPDINDLFNKKYEMVELPVIYYDEFKNMDFKDKKEFFSAFLKLTSQTPTHFLSYLELYKDGFKLSEEEQKLFIEMLNEFHKNNYGFLEIVKNKLLKFNIINENIINENENILKL